MFNQAQQQRRVVGIGAGSEQGIERGQAEAVLDALAQRGVASVLQLLGAGLPLRADPGLLLAMAVDQPQCLLAQHTCAGWQDRHARGLRSAELQQEVQQRIGVAEHAQAFARQACGVAVAAPGGDVRARGGKPLGLRIIAAQGQGGVDQMLDPVADAYRLPHPDLLCAVAGPQPAAQALVGVAHLHAAARVAGEQVLPGRLQVVRLINDQGAKVCRDLRPGHHQPLGQVHDIDAEQVAVHGLALEHLPPQVLAAGQQVGRHGAGQAGSVAVDLAQAQQW